MKNYKMNCIINFIVLLIATISLIFCVSESDPRYFMICWNAILMLFSGGFFVLLLIKAIAEEVRGVINEEFDEEENEDAEEDKK